jgi:hypothetical protein
VFKPAITWEVLPGLIRDRLVPDGIAVFNLLAPPSGIWIREMEWMSEMFGEARLVSFDDFANRILVAGKVLPAARAFGASLRSALRRIGSRQAGRIHARTLGRGARDLPGVRV